MLAMVFGLSLSASTSAMSKNEGPFSNIRISNFGQMDERFYRGAQPKERDYQVLADLGIKTFIDLRNDTVASTTRTRTRTTKR